MDRMWIVSAPGGSEFEICITVRPRSEDRPRELDRCGAEPPEVEGAEAHLGRDGEWW